MSTEKKTGRKYTEEFNVDALALVTERGYKVSQAARGLGINDNLLRRWRQVLVDKASSARLSTNEREELKRLRKEVRMLRLEKAILKSQSAPCKGNEVKYAFIREHAGRRPVVHLCRPLEVPCSAYYDWRNRPGPVIPPEEVVLRRRMKALFIASLDSLGRCRLGRKLREEGFEIGRHRNPTPDESVEPEGQSEAPLQANHQQQPVCHRTQQYDGGHRHRSPPEVAWWRSY